MAKPTFKIECPCCQAKLTIDVELRAIVAHEPPPPPRSVVDLGTAFTALGSKAADREQRFKRELDAQGQKGKVLERKFEEGLKKAKESPDPPRRPFDAD